MPQEFTTPVGRIVWGNPAVAKMKKDKNNQPVMRDGAQVEEWACGVAYPKADFETHILPILQNEAATLFPHGTPPNFAWKYKDGDGIDNKGKPFNTREGYAGHYVLNIATQAFAPPIFKLEAGVYRQMEPKEVKCGDYVVVKLNIKANQPSDPTHTPGIYVNPNGFEHVGYGEEIVNVGSDPDEMFGKATYTLPPGASAAPVAPLAVPVAPLAVPGVNSYQAAVSGVVASPAQAAPVAPAPQAAPVAPAPQAAPVAPAPQAALPAPAHDFVANAGQAMPGIPAGR